MSLGFLGGVVLILLTWAVTWLYMRRSTACGRRWRRRPRACAAGRPAVAGAPRRDGGRAMTVLASRPSTSSPSPSSPLVLAITLGITYWASKRTRTATEFWAAGRGISGVQNGFAIAGDYLSASTFLGFAGLIFLYGLDGWVGLAAARRVVPARAAAARRADAQRGQVHDRRRARLPAAASARRGSPRRSARWPVVRLPGRADGRRGRAAPGARRHRLRARGRC